MSKREYKKRMNQRKRRSAAGKVKIVLCSILCIGILGAGVYYAGKNFGSELKKIVSVSETAETHPQDVQTSAAETVAESTDVSQTTEGGAETEESTEINSAVDNIIADAAAAAIKYDYDGAIALLTESEYASSEAVQQAVAEYEQIKSTLVRQNIKEITHVFFHSLIIDTAKAFDGDSHSTGYNQMMTTKEEFIKIMQSMYDRGYVLVGLHDMASEVTGEDGKTVMTVHDIMLPEGKKAFVLSQDDVCYYPYMEGDGFASRMVVGEDGLPVCEMKMDDGSISVGAYDVVPVLDEFIKEHPDFSYKGAKGIVAFTGYEGILGYRTAASYSESDTYESDRAEAARVVQCLRDDGWEIASHSWGHRYMGSMDYSLFREDTDKWENEVETLTGPVDIILYPFGDDIGDWSAYTSDNDRYNYLYSKGFRYFCNVDSNPTWVQVTDAYLRQGRRNLDGYRMYYDLINPDTDRLGDLFDVAEVFDKSRPTPVEAMGSY